MKLKTIERRIRGWWEDCDRRTDYINIKKGSFVYTVVARAGFHVYCDLIGDEYEPPMHLGEGFDYDDTAKLIYDHGDGEE